MKKNLLAALLVAILASSMVFAGFSGSATAEFGWKIDDKQYGFDNIKGSKFQLTLDSLTGESKGEGEVYAGVKATLTLSTNEVKNNPEVKTNVNPATLILTAKISGWEAYVMGENWSVSLLDSMANPNFASSYTKNSDGSAKWNYNADPLQVAGLTVKVYDYAVGVGFNKNYAENNRVGKNGALLTLQTPEYTLAEGLTAQAGAGFGTQSKEFKNSQFGFGGKVAYAQGDLKASVATDMGVAVVDEKSKFDMDVAANVAYSPVSFDLYYATKVDIKDRLNMKVSTTLDDYVGFPLSFSLDLQDLVHDERTLAANATAKLLEKKLGLGLTYKTTLKNPVAWSIKGEASYDFGVAAVSGEATYTSKDSASNANTLAIKATASSEKLVNNATLALSYSDILLNFNEGQDHKAGKIVASCTVKF